MYYNQIYSKLSQASAKLEKVEYEQCVFENCDFYQVDLSKVVFVDCTFKECNLSSANINHTAFREVKFIDCKLMGLHFEHCNEFLLAMEFENCVLDLSNFYRKKLKKTSFKNCSIKEVDFTDADLTEAKFENCDLFRGVFDNTNMEKADLSTSYNFIINPEINLIRNAKFSLNGLPGLLSKYDIEIN